MFKALAKIFHREEPDELVDIHELRPFWKFQMFNAEEEPTLQSRIVDIYYVFYRFFRWSSWSSPKRLYREAKWFIQRGRRGWADCDTWSLDDYLSGWLPGALRHLKEHKHGVPCNMFEAADCDEDGNSTEAGMKTASARWDDIMDKMIAGFKAHQRIADGLYEDELGEYPMDRPSGVSADAWEKIKDDRLTNSQSLIARDQKIVEEGMALFVKHYSSLWD